MAESEKKPTLWVLKGGAGGDPAPLPAQPREAAPEESETALVLEVLRGSEAAVRRFVRRYSPVLLAVIDRVLLRAGRAGRGEDRDIMQQVFLEVFRDEMRYLRGWDPTRGKSLRGFLCVLADHRAHDALRKKGMDWLLDPELPGRESGSGETPEDEHRLRQLLEIFTASLDEDKRRIFSWYFIENRDIKAIAADLKISTQTAHQRCHRLRERLLDLLSETEERPQRPGAVLAKRGS